MPKLHNNYKPSEHEEYMCEKHLEYFKNKLLNWRAQLKRESTEMLDHLKEEDINDTDPYDRANLEGSIAIQLRSKDRVRKLMEKIDIAIDKINSAEYGYCEESGEKIGLRRLDARPIAMLSIAAQEAHESFEKHHNDEII